VIFRQVSLARLAIFFFGSLEVRVWDSVTDEKRSYIRQRGYAFGQFVCLFVSVSRITATYDRRRMNFRDMLEGEAAGARKVD